MVGWVGLEPTANGLKGRCSTTELPTPHRKALNVAHGEIVRKPFCSHFAASHADLDQTHNRRATLATRRLILT